MFQPSALVSHLQSHLDISKYYNSSYLSIVLYRFLLSTYFLLLFLYLYSLFSSDSDYLAWVAGDIVHNHVNISFTDDQLLPGINNYNSNPHGPNRGKQFYTHNPRLFLFINIVGVIGIFFNSFELFVFYRERHHMINSVNVMIWSERLQSRAHLMLD